MKVNKVSLILFDWVSAVLAATAVGTVFSAPYAVKLLTGSIYQGGFVGEYSSLEVATVATLHAYAGSCQIGRANVGSLEIENKHLEMDSRTEHPFQSGL